MLQNLTSVAALLVSFAVMCLGHGLQSVLLPARGAMFPDYPNMVTGAMMSAYFMGFIIGTFLWPRLIERVGHIRVFAAGAAGAAVIMLMHPLFANPVTWILLRAVYGFCLVGLYTVMESWLNSIGTQETRGRILSVYMIINFTAMSLGQMLFFLAPIEGFELFSISAVLLTLALTPLILSRSVQPVATQTPERLKITQLIQASPLGAMGALMVGLVGGAYWGLSAAFVLRLGLGQSAAAWFMSASLLGGLLAQWPLGALSDRINRRYVILLAACLILLSSGLLTVMALWDNPSATFGAGWIIAAGAAFGAGYHPLYSLCIAHANDFLAPQHFVRASIGLQSVQSMGAIIGPLLAGLFMFLGGNAMLYGYICLLSILFIFYIIIRMTGNRQPITGERKPFRFLERVD